MGIDFLIRIWIIHGMMKRTTIPAPLYDCVLALLEQRKGEWRQIAQELDMSYSSLCKIAQKHNDNPSVHVVQRLYDFLTSEQRAA
jgi:hypothetical protein